jgi:hypothetical protein
MSAEFKKAEGKSVRGGLLASNEKRQEVIDHTFQIQIVILFFKNKIKTLKSIC